MKYLIELDSDRLFLETVMEHFGGRVLAHLPSLYASELLHGNVAAGEKARPSRLHEPVTQVITSLR